jgi:hypothetical protein
MKFATIISLILLGSFGLMLVITGGRSLSELIASFLMFLLGYRVRQENE